MSRATSFGIVCLMTFLLLPMSSRAQPEREQIEQFAFLVGTFDCVGQRANSENERFEYKAHWQGRYTHGGLAIEDEYWVPGPDGRNVVHGTNYRTWDPSLSRWRIRWYEAISSTWQDLEASSFGQGMRVWGDAQDDQGRYDIRIDFFDISDEGFRWRQDRRDEGEQNWQEGVVRIDCRRAGVPDPGDSGPGDSSSDDSSTESSPAASGSAESSAEPFVDWYRQVRTETWVWSGADRDRLGETLTRIRVAGERAGAATPDGIATPGPGQWIYEFERTAEAAKKKAEQAVREGDLEQGERSYVEASTYYMIASFPHFRQPAAQSALASAFETYEAAGELMTPKMERWDVEIDGETVIGYAHLPRPELEPWPVVLKTGGMDVVRTEFHPLRRAFLDRGIALVLFDMPGTGNSSQLGVDAERHHVAMLDRVGSDPRFDRSRVALWSESLAGNPLVKTAILEGPRIAAAVNDCGILHQVFAGRSQGRPSGMQYEVFADRVGVAPDDYEEVRERARPISLVVQGILDGEIRTDTPILSVTTHEDPLVPLAETLLAVQASTRGQLWLTGRYGHCAPRSESMPSLVRWLEDALLGSD